VKPHLPRTRFIPAIAGVLVIAMFGGWAYGQANSQASSAPNPYRAVEGWGKTLPDGRQWGSTNAVTVDSKGNVWVAERCGANSCADSALDPILEFDASGKLVKSLGGGLFVVPHGVYIDKAGNIWATDNSGKDGKGQQVIKFGPDGKILMRLGKAGVAGDGPDTFNQPDGVVVSPNGDIFVADGHSIGMGNARVVKFSSDGKFIMQWGEHGSGPGQFEVPHSIGIDSKGRIFVADRGNKRLQIFDQDGKFLDQWTQFGEPSGLFIDPHDALYVADSQSESSDPKRPAYNPGFEQGIRVGSAKDGKVTAFIPIPPPPDAATNAPEGVAADASGSVYGADVVLKDIRQYVKQ
jgi:sugar lactone lactonase YvrE